MNMSDAILQLENLSKSFGGIKAVQNVSLEVKQGSICGLIGPNGSGKSTLFNLISGSIKRDGGKVTFDGKRIDGHSPDKIARSGLGRTFQTPRLFPRMTVLDNTLVAPLSQKGEIPWNAMLQGKWKKQEIEIAKKAKTQLGFLELEKLFETPASDISGGQMKLLQLARSLMTEPKMVMLDEPTAGVAPRLAGEIFEDIEKQRKNHGTTFFIIEHRLEILFNYVDLVFVMHRGELIASGKSDEVVQDRRVIESYLG